MNGTNGMNSLNENNEKEETISKTEIAGMERISFQGKIKIVDTIDKCVQAVDFLKTYRLLGFDTETRPSFRKGQMHTVALMQISTKEVCYLFRLNKIGIPPSLQELLTSGKIRKIGLSLRDDFGMLRKLIDFEPAGFVELQTYVRDFNIQEQSLQKIYALLFDKKISKNQRLSNWEAETLTTGQKQYAATDAWACIEIYEYLEKQKGRRNDIPYEFKKKIVI